MGTEVDAARDTGPGFTTNRGPRGPSKVNAAIQPCSSARRIPRRARTAKRLLEPRTFTKPNLCIMRPVYSPSKLSLLITRILRSRHRYIAGIMQACQKEYTNGRASSEPGEPSSQEMAIFTVEQIVRMTRNPVHSISHSRHRCQRVNCRKE